MDRTMHTLRADDGGGHAFIMAVFAEIGRSKRHVAVEDNLIFIYFLSNTS
jgi:hypothetical protein